jgi:hypothetical protein
MHKKWAEYLKGKIQHHETMAEIHRATGEYLDGVASDTEDDVHRYHAKSMAKHFKTVAAGHEAHAKFHKDLLAEHEAQPETSTTSFGNWESTTQLPSKVAKSNWLDRVIEQDDEYIGL